MADALKTPDLAPEEESAKSVVYQTPYDFSPVARLGRHLVRKQILPLGSINYVDSNGRSREVTFTSETLDAIIKSYNEKPFDFVPLKLATEKNAHSDDVLRNVGEIKGFERNPNGGLDIIGELDDDGIKAIQKADGKLGISARFHESYLRNHDGRDFGSAISHGLLCDRAYITGMDGWQEIDMAGDEGEVVDLSAEEWLEPEEAQTPEEPGEDDSEEDETFLTEEEERLVAEVMLEMDLAHKSAPAKDVLTKGDTVDVKAGDKVTFNQFGKVLEGEVVSIDTSGQSPVAVVKTADGKEHRVPLTMVKAKGASSASKGNQQTNMSETTEAPTIDLSDAEHRRILELAEARAAERYEARLAEADERSRRTAFELREQRLDAYLDERLRAGVAPWVIDLTRPVLLEEGADEEIEVVELSGEGESAQRTVSKTTRADVLKKLLNGLDGMVELGERGTDDVEVAKEDITDAEYEAYLRAVGEEVNNNA